MGLGARGTSFAQCSRFGRPVNIAVGPERATLGRMHLDDFHHLDMACTGDPETVTRAEDAYAGHVELYGENLAVIALLVGRIHGLLRDNRAMVYTAESCTAGGIAAALSMLSGASDVLIGGRIVYQNEAKVALGVGNGVIREHTEVSAECARHMAWKARAEGLAIMPFSLVVGISITGHVNDPAHAYIGVTGERHTAVGKVVQLQGETRIERQQWAVAAALDRLFGFLHDQRGFDGV